MTPAEQFRVATRRVRDAGAITFQDPLLTTVVLFGAPIAGAYAGAKLWTGHPILGGIGGFFVGRAAGAFYAASKAQVTP